MARLIENALDAVSLTVEALAMADCLCGVGFRRDDGLDPAQLHVGSNRVGVVSFVGEECVRCALLSLK
jgi:hypothetical protein